MIDQEWEAGLRESISEVAGATRVVPPPTDAIVRRGRHSVRRRNALFGSGAVLVAAAVIAAGTLWGHGFRGTSDADAAAPSPGAAVAMGPADAKVVVRVYDDYLCPTCRILNSLIGPTLEARVAAGEIRVEYRAVDQMDEVFGGDGSLRAGNAAQCAADSGKFFAYRDALLADQPGVQNDTYAEDGVLFYVAGTIPGLDTKAFERCVASQPYSAEIRKNTAHLHGPTGDQYTPYIEIGDKAWTVQPGQDAVQSLTAALDDAAR